MAKAKASAKGQQSLTSFFGGSKAPVNDSTSESEAPAQPSKTDSKVDSSDLPPIHDIPAMFSDLVGRIPEIKDVAERVNGRKLRVATMCSGTESPLLALDLICQVLREEHDVTLDIDHVFSCEITPFKQAYIERNFQPPLLFRDVCELGDPEATTAYGALAPVPGDVDLLVAGTSCVDYSNLNNEKQDIDAGGESGRTFHGMMSWVKNHRPPMVILENVCSAPWEKVSDYFEKNGYSATWTRVDTKQYYIPHTRTRVYLLAVDQKRSNKPKLWKEWVCSKLKRPASSTLDAFLLPSDDSRIHQARQKLVQESGEDRRTGRTDWTRCESRHQRARLDELLGPKRPLTNWDDGGACRMPDFAWGDWGIRQVERVWDLMDISLLRSAQIGVDPSFKTLVWNLSQNVDRSTGSSKAGICPCLTPTMIPYITNRGGPMVGVEALSMQGLPIDKLLLTRESEDQLADLAGNAMSSTVIGACILAALVVGKDLLKKGDDKETYEAKNGNAMDSGDDNAMIIDPVPQSSANIEDHICGYEQLIQKPLDLAATATDSLEHILGDAQRSVRLCYCEGRKDVITRELMKCKDCGFSVCKKCGGRPEHNFEPMDVLSQPRLLPSTFERELKSALPMCLSLANVTEALLDGLKAASGASIPEKRWTRWRSAVLRATEAELRFVEPKRQEMWSVVYQSPFASFELYLHPQQVEWRLFAKPEINEPANAEIRRWLQMPVGRFICEGGLFSGRWQFGLPHTTEIDITIEGTGDLVPAWEARLGLLGADFRDRVVHSKLRITVPKGEVSRFDRDISGTYVSLDKCGSANGTLHKRMGEEGEETLPPLFMLLDPTRCGNPNEDTFVFSTSTRRYEYAEFRPLVCKLDRKWRQSDVEGPQDVTCYIPSLWVDSNVVEIKSLSLYNATCSVPEANLNVIVSTEACASANALLVCTVPLSPDAGPEWPRGEWREVDKVHERGTFRAIAWLLERSRHVDDYFNDWQNIELTEDPAHCTRCAPIAPTIKWTTTKNKIVAIEDSRDAGQFERDLKLRPTPFVTQLKMEDNIGTVRVGLNIPSLLHRALSRLSSKNRPERPALSWRLDTDFASAVKINLPPFTLSSNKADVQHLQPPNFKVPLRPEQLRSLTWMLRQEARDTAPFIEEEISEAILEPLGWRAEGRAQRAVRIRGGVLADEVGYGKTAITLGLIDCASKNVREEFEKVDGIAGKIPVKSTLVVVPPHLTRQWASEAQKFAPKRFKKTVVISTAAQLNSLTIEEVQEADIVIVASNLWKSDVYVSNLEAFAAGGPLPNKEGRYFDNRLDATLVALQSQVDLLKAEGSMKVMKVIRDTRNHEDEMKAALFVPPKRLKGKQYRKAAADAENGKDLKQDDEREDKFSAKPGPSGLTVEVVISVPPPKTKASGVKHSVTSDESDAESDVPKARPRRRLSGKSTIVVSDNEDDESMEERAPKKTKGKSGKQSRPKEPPPSESSDYEDNSDEGTENDPDDDEEPSHSSDDESSRPSKSKGTAKAMKKKPKPKPKPTKKRTASSASDDTGSDAMDVDPPSSPSSNKSSSKKRKATDSNGAAPAKKQKRREDTDPWNLESMAVKKDWTQMRSPPLEIFHFARVVVDEYTYLGGTVHSMVTKLTADRRWVLSGTPPLHSFGAVKTIAAHLDLHLGIDDDSEGQTDFVKKRIREQTDAEKFHNFREVHSQEWHAHRHRLGQAFLDGFVRQNIAEIDEIPCTFEIKKIILPAAERAIYLELEHHLRALDMTIRRGRKTESDREKRLNQSLGESKTAEEALLKRCSHFDLDPTDKENAMKACEIIVKERTKQLEECKTELLKQLKQAVKTEKKIGKTGDESMFQEYARVCRSEGVGDKDAAEAILKLLDEADVPASSSSKNKGKKDEIKLSNATKDLMWEHREHTHDIRKLTKELVARVRSLRYFTVVRDLQKQRETPPDVACPSCERSKVPMDEVAVLSSCGHMGCMNCVKLCADREECVYAISGDCKAAARSLNVVKGDTLGVDDEARDGKGKHYGMKLEKVIELIAKKIPGDERVLIFVQFVDLMKKVADALAAHKIKFLEIKGTASQKSKNLEKFQNGGERVLLLNVTDESASGANLTSANHAIFLSPLLCPTQEVYNACETQAIGRLRRYGQTNHVRIWRFLTTDTIDIEIFEQRTKPKV
ncbi:hypothetical protein BJ138DRAFT_1122797 [Hygrophoropsis aurantiaca]|uniref:Uncharacterized protein n=1 Tax=Hygrophoropsis aurantiaca TaxID=72124 RepID=A0ACB8APW5_9AGAM|nr:hypothetical protein BJ138DRAFT_1122797 [Hygrophoropsis aurantiaca]